MVQGNLKASKTFAAGIHDINPAGALGPDDGLAGDNDASERVALHFDVAGYCFPGREKSGVGVEEEDEPPALQLRIDIWRKANEGAFNRTACERRNAGAERGSLKGFSR